MLKLFKRVLFFVCLGIAVQFCMAATTQAYRSDDTAYLSKYLNVMQGDWYNSADQLVLNIANGNINGCAVTNCFDIAGGTNQAGGWFRIVEDAGSRDVELHWHIFGNGHDSLSFNGQPLHK